MRLTLRTLLAWLDDTLPPHETHEIGKQAAETATAQELADRIARVIRQRRLMVPDDAGAEGIDPNVTAAYLEDQLSADEVLEYEKRCLNSDVCLAETASVHQIISLLGQRAKVPPAARHRMYRLLKGDTQRRGTTSEPALDLGALISPKAEPLPELDPPTSSEVARRWTAALSLVALIAIAGWFALRPVPQHRVANNNLIASNTNPNQPAPAQPLGEGLKIEAPPAAKTDENLQATDEKADPAASEKIAADPDMKKDAEANPNPAPVGNLGEIKITDRQGVVFRYSTERQAWEPLPPDDPRMPTGERLAVVEPSRLAIQAGGGESVLLGPAQWEALSPGSNAARFRMTQGRIILTAPVPAKTYEILVDSAKLTITLPPGGQIGIEPIHVPQPGGARSPLEVWIASTQPDTRLSGVGDKEFTLEAGTYRLGLADETLTQIDKKLPQWLENNQLDGLAKEIAREFGQFFQVQPTVVKALFGAVEDPKEPIRRAAVKALGTLGYIDLVMDLLAKEQSPNLRQAAMETLRTILDQGGDAAIRVNKEITDRYNYDEVVAQAIRKLLEGYAPQEIQANPKILNQLVDQLESNELPIRELSIDILSSITGRDRLGYDADNPAPGANAWKQLLRRGELNVVAAPGDNPNP